MSGRFSAFLWPWGAATAHARGAVRRHARLLSVPPGGAAEDVRVRFSLSHLPRPVAPALLCWLAAYG